MLIAVSRGTVGKAPCPQGPAPPALLHLSPEPVHIYPLESCTSLFYFTGPALLFALGALFSHIAGGPMFNLSSRLNITSAIARGIHTCQPLYSVFVNSTPGHRPRLCLPGSSL